MSPKSPFNFVFLLLGRGKNWPFWENGIYSVNKIIKICISCCFAHLFWASGIKIHHFRDRVRNMNKGCCAWGQILLPRKYFQWNFQVCDREWAIATPPHSLQTQLVLGCCLKGLEVGEVPGRAVWHLEKGPSVVHWGMMKSVHLLDSGKGVKFGLSIFSGKID